jgi:L,D-peptidoglycan transpeptidase YkuD (ErfK/YbiS/YcfS/YnhG family)
MRQKRSERSHTPSVITVRQRPGHRNQALVRFGPVVVQAALGRSGIGINKREGDGKTPRAGMALLSGFQRGERIGNLSTTLPMRRILASMLWCDAANHACYNRLVRAPFVASHEKMARNDSLYDICLVMDWNISSRRRNGGSAIFFHLARPGYLPTEGCIALATKDMRRLIRHFKTGMVVKVV